MPNLVVILPRAHSDRERYSARKRALMGCVSIGVRGKLLSYLVVERVVVDEVIVLLLCSGLYKGILLECPLRSPTIMH